MTEKREGATVLNVAIRDDAADLEWLDERISSIESGVDALIEIAENWIEGREIGRLFPQRSAAEVIRERLPADMKLGRPYVERMLTHTALSKRQIAEIAGTSRQEVDRTQTQLAQAGQFERPAETLGRDGIMRNQPARPIVIMEPAAPAISPEDEALYRRLLAALREITACRYDSTFLASLPDRHRDRLREAAKRAQRSLVDVARDEVRLIGG